MSNFLERVGRFFKCFKKQDHERDAFDRLVSRVDAEVTKVFDSKVDEYKTKAGRFIDDWMDGQEHKECKSALNSLTGDIRECFGEGRSMMHDLLEYKPPSKFERFCGRVEQLFDDLFGD